MIQQPTVPQVSSDPLPRRLLGVLTGLCTFMTVWVLVYPFNFAPQPGAVWLDAGWLGKINSAVNLMLFAPYGALAACLGRALWPGRAVRTVVMVTVVGGVLSLMAETAQVWLPLRDSSLADLAANVLGGAVGSVVGWVVAPRFNGQAVRLYRWFEDRPRGRWALAAVLVLIVLKAAPFDVSPETFYLRMSLGESFRSGGPFSACRAVLGGAREAAEVLAAKGEAVRSVFAVVMFAVVAGVMGRAVRYGGRARGQAGAGTVPYGSLLFVLFGLVLSTEIVQWLVRSRLMDATDLVAGCGGVIAGLAAEWLGRGRAPVADEDPVRIPWAVALLALLMTVLAVYVSLVPFTPRYVEFGEAVARFSREMGAMSVPQAARSDWAINGMAFTVLAFMWLAGLSRVVGGGALVVGVVAVVWGGLVAMGAGLEFAQVYFPPRVSNPHDIVAQAAGATAGVGLWWVAGPSLIRPIERAINARGLDTVRPLLQVYLGCYLFYAVMPLDIVVRPSEIKIKWVYGMIALNPLNEGIFSSFDDAWKRFRDVALAVPLGLILAQSRRITGWGTDHRRLWLALLAGAVVVVAIECLHVVIRSRAATVGDVLTSMVGVGIGVGLARLGLVRLRGWRAGGYAGATAAYALGMLVLYTAPWEFDRGMLFDAAARRYFATVPFATLQFGTAFPALDDLMFPLLLALPLGVLIGGWAAGSAGRLADHPLRVVIGLAGATGALVGIGVFQAAVPERIADPTGAIVGAVGAAVGVFLAGQWGVRAEPGVDARAV